MEGSTVMIVEDDPGMLDILKVNLEHAGCRVTRARDGVEACATIETARPDAVILDLDMPKMSGFRLVKLLRRDPIWKRLPIIMVTAFAFEEVEDLADEGIQGFLRKPFNPSDLVSKVKYALDRRKGAAA